MFCNSKIGVSFVFVCLFWSLSNCHARHWNLCIESCTSWVKQKLNITLFSRRKSVKKMARWIREQECRSLNILPLRWYDDDDDDSGLHSFPFLGIKQSYREDSTLIVLSLSKHADEVLLLIIKASLCTIEHQGIPCACWQGRFRCVSPRLCAMQGAWCVNHAG